MKKKAFCLFIAASIILSFLTLFTREKAAADDGEEYEQFLKQGGYYSRVVNYLRDIRKEKKKEKPLKPGFGDTVILFGADLLLSLFCLWLARLLLIGKRDLFVKAYPWFFFIINLGWFMFLLFLKLIWGMLDFLVVKLQPDLGPMISDNFSLFIIIGAVLIYIWLAARTFELSFFGASGVFLASHTFYLLTIFLFFLFVNCGENRVLSLAKKTLGAKPIIEIYLSDADKIASGSIMSLVRIRPFHI